MALTAHDSYSETVTVSDETLSGKHAIAYDYHYSLAAN